MKIVETIKNRTTERGKLPLVTRHYEPVPLLEFLEWQVGLYEQRPMEEPVYEFKTDLEGKEFVTLSVRTHPSLMVTVFHLLGYGPSYKEAMARALRVLAQD
ncbi:MAG: hypothetical protein KGR46_11990 [Verrucomicrobia bacterium]|nr:hypothetical protein [Verrucomicrobiota bacterium]